MKIRTSERQLEIKDTIIYIKNWVRNTRITNLHKIYFLTKKYEARRDSGKTIESSTVTYYFLSGAQKEKYEGIPFIIYIVYPFILTYFFICFLRCYFYGFLTYLLYMFYFFVSYFTYRVLISIVLPQFRFATLKLFI
jgi:hypothetical protein